MMMIKTIAQKNDRFALEQAIHVAWSTVEDLKIYVESIVDFGDFNSEITEDSVVNTVTALAEVSDLRFRKLWDVFENFVQYHNIHARSPEEIKEVLEMRSQIFEHIQTKIKNVRNLCENSEEFGQEKL